MTHRIISSVVTALVAMTNLSAHAESAPSGDGFEADQSSVIASDRVSSGNIASGEAASRALDYVKRERAVVESQFSEDEALCYKKFFVTSCMDAAKDRRRVALKRLNAIEVEANAYNRRARVEQKDQALKEREEKQQAKTAERGQIQSSATQDQTPPTPKDIAEIESRSQEAASSPASEPGKHGNAKRAASLDEERRQALAQENAEAKKRAENIRAYEKKQQRSLERQREIAEKKRDKRQDHKDQPAGPLR